jgi:rare lipoprotein A
MITRSKIAILLAVYLLGTGGALASQPQGTCHARSHSCARGIASWYGGKFQGHRTASGEAFDRAAMTAAHPSLPFRTKLLVTNLSNGRTVTVRVNDRGPGNGRLIDLSEAAARRIGMMERGFTRIEMRVARN